VVSQKKKDPAVDQDSESSWKSNTYKFPAPLSHGGPSWRETHMPLFVDYRSWGVNIPVYVGISRTSNTYL
jgi:hypothetical protein